MPVQEKPFRCPLCDFKSVVLRDCLIHFSKEHPGVNLQLQIPMWDAGDANSNEKSTTRVWDFIPSSVDCSSIVNTTKDSDIIQENLCLSLIELMQEGHENEILSNFFELTDYVKYSIDTECLFYILEMWHSDKKLQMDIDGEATSFFHKTFPNGLTPNITPPEEMNGNAGEGASAKTWGLVNDLWYIQPKKICFAFAMLGLRCLGLWIFSCMHGDLAED